MKIECVKDNLLKAIGLVDKITGKKLPLLVLGKILIEVKGKEIILRATNLDMGIEIIIPGKIIKEGNVLIPGALIESHLMNLPAHSNVVLEEDNGNLLISTKASLVKITCEKVEDFPILPIVDKEKGEMVYKFNINGSKFSNGIRSVAYAASLSDIKPELASVYLYNKDKELTITATDSFRLAEKIIELDDKNDELPPVLIPIKNAMEIARIFSELNSIVDIKYNSNLLTIKSEGIYVTSRLIRGAFPAYTHIIPKNFRTQVVTLKEDLLGSLRLVSIFADKFSQITLRAIPEDGVFELEAKNQERGESAVSIDTTTEGERVNVSINARYLLDGLQAISKDSITIGFNDSNKPLLVRGVGDQNFTYLIMPLHK